MTKNFKGGYKIVSLNGNDLASGDSFVVSGLYENLVNSYKKPILVTEIVINGEKQQDSFAVVKQSDGGYKIDVYDYALTVTSEDAVTIAEVTQVNSIGGVSGDITIGTGLAMSEDGELSAESSGSLELYQHIIEMGNNDTNYTWGIIIIVYSTSGTPFTASTLFDYIGTKRFLANGAIWGNGGVKGRINFIDMASATAVDCYYTTQFDNFINTSRRNSLSGTQGFFNDDYILKIQ